MTEFLEKSLPQVPSLAVLVFLTVIFLRFLEKTNTKVLETFREIHAESVELGRLSREYITQNTQVLHQANFILQQQANSLHELKSLVHTPIKISLEK